MSYPYSNGSVWTEDCSVITDWTDGDFGAGADSSQVAYDGQETMSLLSGNAGSYARRTRGGTALSRSVVSIKLYHSALGTLGAADYFNLTIGCAANLVDIKFATDGLFILSGGTDNEVGVNIVSTGAWQLWTFDIDDTNDTVDVYKYVTSQYVLQGTAACSNAAATPNVALHQAGSTTANRRTYVDYILEGNGFASW